jgi:transcriptional regulator with PAS, ATPase and Fis domain
MNLSYFDEIGNAVTVCDTEGIILYMNQKAIETFAKYGGGKLVGTNLLDCHPEPSKTKVKDMLENQQANTYMIEKEGKKKLIHQVPWYDRGVFGGLIEISIVLPDEMPTFQRK